MLLFLHGFLGQKEDWDPLFSHLDLPHQKLAIDLPGHGQSPFSEDAALAIKKTVPCADILIGYSAGGRIALELKERFPNDYKTVIAISAHPGLKTEEEKRQRWTLEEKWIDQLQSYDSFLDEWYNQEIFARLKKSPHFLSMLKRRKLQNPTQLAAFLHHNSLAKKSISEIFPSTIFIYGKEDLKYEKLYRKLDGIHKVYSIENASHAIHLENPQALATRLEEIIYERDNFKRNTAQI